MSPGVPVYRLSIRLSRERTLRDAALRDPVSDPERAHAAALALLGDRDREALLAMYLDARNQVSGAEIVSVGALNCTRTLPREIFRGAIVAGSCGIILAHNHPSGNPEASAADLRFLEVIKQGAEAVGMELYDFLIVAGGRVVSLRESGSM